MNPYGFYGDVGRGGRYSVSFGRTDDRYLLDQDNYMRASSRPAPLDRFMAADYARSRSRDMMRSRYQQRSGSLDRMQQPRYDVLPRVYMDERFDVREPQVVYANVERWLAPPRDLSRRSYPRYAGVGYMDDVDYNPYAVQYEPFLTMRPTYDNYGQNFEQQHRERYDQERIYQGYNKYVPENRYEGERTAYQQQRPVYDDSRREQSKFRAENERQSRSDVKRVTRNIATENKAEPKIDKKIKFRQSERESSAAKHQTADDYRRNAELSRDYSYDSMHNERQNDGRKDSRRDDETSRKSSVARRQEKERDRKGSESFTRHEDESLQGDKKVSDIVEAYEKLATGEERRKESMTGEDDQNRRSSSARRESGKEKFQEVFQGSENENRKRNSESKIENQKETMDKKDSKEDMQVVKGFEQQDDRTDEANETGSEIRRKHSSARQSTASPLPEALEKEEEHERKKSTSGPESGERKKSFARSESPVNEDNKSIASTRQEDVASAEGEHYKFEREKPDQPHDQEQQTTRSEEQNESFVVETHEMEVKRSRTPSNSSAYEGDKDGSKADEMVNDRPQRRVKIQEKREICHEKIYTYDQMPPTIPPCADQGNAYAPSKPLNIEDEDQMSGHNRGLAVRATYDIMRRQYYERTADPTYHPAWLRSGDKSDSVSNISQGKEDIIRVEYVDFHCIENSKVHKSFEYELVQDDEQSNPVLRRGQTFKMDVVFNGRPLDLAVDSAHINFYFGPNPSVPKRTRVVLPITSHTQFTRVPHQWDIRMLDAAANRVTVEISVPSSAPVGLWKCVVETLNKEETNSHVLFTCNEEVYIIFNPFNKDDNVYVDDDEERYEYVINDAGKIYTGSYRNVKGRPWIYGQFDDCVLPAACVLLEMSGLAHAERSNPLKVVKALASMIKSSRFSHHQVSSDNEEIGLVEAKYDDTSLEGKSPHLWSGSVQIIEEFLRTGASPVKYGQCWVMAGLMTTLCRTLGLPTRPVTAFVSAADTQDTMAVDRYVDRFGDLQQDGPSSDQTGSLWSFHVWCEVWMSRPDLTSGFYGGWQATDPGRTFRDFRNTVKGSCGPCPVAALKAGDIGQRDDVDAFFAAMNAYVRYFYEDEESSWGYSPFRQFRYPVSQYVLTKAVGKLDDQGEADCSDITGNYREETGTPAEKFQVFNHCRGLKDLPVFEYQAAAYDWAKFDPNGLDDGGQFDVRFDFAPPESVMIGQPFKVNVNVTNLAAEAARTLQVNICTRACLYTGCLGPYIKRTTRQLSLAAEEADLVSLALDHWDYEDKVQGLANVKITVTGFVQETQQSYVQEFDYVFKKPFLNLKASPELRVGEEGSASLSFTNPLDVALTDCFFTFEMAGAVRPRTVRVDGDVRPGQQFSYTHPFMARRAGEHLMVACFSSQQLSDVVGHLTVPVLE